MVTRLSIYRNDFVRKLSVYYGRPDSFLINMYKLHYNTFLSVFDRDYNYKGCQKMLSGYNYKENQLSYYSGPYEDMLSNYDYPCDDEDEDENCYG